MLTSATSSTLGLDLGGSRSVGRWSPVQQASMTLKSKNDIDFCTHTSPAMSPPLASRSAPCQTNHRAA